MGETIFIGILVSLSLSVLYFAARGMGRDLCPYCYYPLHKCDCDE